MAADSAGGICFTDPLGVRYIRADGTITRVSGGADFGFAGDDASAGPGTQYDYPTGIALNTAGEIIIADTDNSRIRKLQPNDATRMDIVSGNNQTGTTGTALNAIIVKLTGKAGVAPAGVSRKLCRHQRRGGPFAQDRPPPMPADRLESPRRRPRRER